MTTEDAIKKARETYLYMGICEVINYRLEALLDIAEAANECNNKCEDSFGVLYELNKALEKFAEAMK